jgi:hypothetical protein
MSNCFIPFGNPNEKVREALSKRFKQWAFDIHCGRYSVSVYHRGNVKAVKDIVKETLGQDALSWYSVHGPKY